MRIVTAIASALAVSAPTWCLPAGFKPSSSYCHPNPRNDRAADRQRAAAKRRNKAKRG
ncbi:hypothetical protein [Aeromonas sp. RU39B]|uniref:hypothetical protein n=1 Tax=Aeromonas sp. RU39B TaxID=1907416 RepID=UPI0015C2E26A|nr:hypothetical protein [Aeromonas sp. RU39B]